MAESEKLRDKLIAYSVLGVALGVPVLACYVLARLFLPPEWLNFHLSTKWQIAGVAAALCCSNWGHGREREKVRKELQSKIDRLEVAVREGAERLEERAARHSDWNRAECEKMMYDAEAGRFYEKVQEKMDEQIDCTDFDDVADKWKKIDEIVEARYPKKKVEDFLRH